MFDEPLGEIGQLLGRAMEGGARGDTVRVMNVDSRKVVHAVVVGPSEVEVLGSEPVALN